MKKPMLSIALAGSLVFSGIAPHAVVHANTPVEWSAFPEGLNAVLITEIMPNSLNIGKSDAYEYIELYNNLSVPVPLQDIKLVYGYPSGESVDWNFIEDKAIQPGETMVVWVKNAANAALTLDDFNQIYGTDIPESHLTYIEADGMHNTKARSIAVATLSNEVYSKVEYTPDQVTEHKSITYKHAAEGSGLITTSEITDPMPGSLPTGQLPSTDSTSPEQEQIPGTTTPEPEQIPDSSGPDQVQSTDTTNPEQTPDTTNPEQEPTPEITVPEQEPSEPAETETDEYDAQQVPYLLVTELVPDSTNVGKLDGYEFIEIYNNSTEDINLNDYTLRYRYPAEGPGGDLIWRHTASDLIIPSGKTMVFWVINSDNGEKTVANFNANYGVNLVEGVDIVKIYNGGMANSSMRGVAIATNTGDDISVAYYFDEPNVDDTKADKGIFYTFPREAGTTTMVKYSGGTEAATPGSVSPVQVPSAKIQLPVTTETLVAEDLTPKEPIEDQQNLYMKFSISEPSVKTVRLFYKTSTETDYRSIYLTHKNSIYSHIIYSPELIGSDAIQYYLEMSDGRTVTQTDIASIDIKNDMKEQTGLNVAQGALLKRIALLKAYGAGASLWINNEDVTALTAPSLSGQAYFAFDVKKVNLYFKNGVTIGDEIIHIFDDTINTYQTLTVPIDPKYFTVGEATKIAIRSGTKVSPFDQESEENRDDFQVKNVRLVLDDGTTIYDPLYSDLDKELLVGDGASATEFFEFAFNVPAEQFKSRAYKWDTTKAANGTHTIEARGEASSKIDVTVDNEAPTISPSIDNGEAYKGEIVIDAEAADEFSGIASLEAQLDGEQITLPYTT
ncbi:lamin tail domain-containing protein, partial [Sporosarcina sp. NCCP-2222]|uniref:lamin tail domain-containing protein n=1 Tax=Sporosarcina sp. NCCP-2222 TaxID=2935073 RepID=UPI0020BEFF37